MNSREQKPNSVDLSDFRLQKLDIPNGRRLSWKYASRMYPASYTYIQPISPNGRPMSWIQVGMAIASGILLLPLLLGAPLLIAVALGRNYPFPH
jgi:hypothetical protein